VDEAGRFAIETIATESGASNGDEITPNLTKGILASSALPVAFSPVPMDVGPRSSYDFIDGGVRENCCLFKAYERQEERIICINCNPSPTNDWPDASSVTSFLNLPHTILAISSHEADLSERKPRNPFPSNKELVVIEPHKLLIGVLDFSKDCTLHALVTGYLRSRIVLALENGVGKWWCMYMLNNIETSLLLKSECERKTYKPVGGTPDSPGYFIPQILEIQAWRRSMQSIYSDLHQLCEVMSNLLKTDKILPSKFNDLKTHSLWLSVLSRSNIQTSAPTHYPAEKNNITELWEEIHEQYIPIPGELHHSDPPPLLLPRVNLLNRPGSSLPFPYWDDPVEAPLRSTQLGIDNTHTRFQ